MPERLARPDLAEKIRAALPFLRRYARALTGNQKHGDTLAAHALEALIAVSDTLETNENPKIEFFKAFHSVWQSWTPDHSETPDPAFAKAFERISKLQKGSREALLLHSLEGLSIKRVAYVMQKSEAEVDALLKTARRDIKAATSGAILLIEDEMIIALDLENIVSDMGHRVCGTARTHKEALELAEKTKPDLILSDIQLADESSGVDAVNDILQHGLDMPVIFITAYPERLLTGKRPEPSFLITKPYSEDQVRSAVSQAMFFSSTDKLG